MPYRDEGKAARVSTAALPSCLREPATYTLSAGESFMAVRASFCCGRFYGGRS